SCDVDAAAGCSASFLAIRVRPRRQTETRIKLIRSDQFLGYANSLYRPAFSVCLLSRSLIPARNVRMSVLKLASDRSNDAVIYGALLLLSGVVFIADILLPLGIAVWVFYLLPMALAYFGWRPQVPLALAAGCTAFVFMGYFWSPNTGFDPQTAAINRT